MSLNCTPLDIELAAKIVNNKVLPKRIRLLEKQQNYNCWGFTAYALRLVKRLQWLRDDVMDKILDTQTHRITKRQLRPGDIIVYRLKRDTRMLLHTAIVLFPKNETIIHKDGQCALEVSTIDGTRYTHNRSSWDAKVFYRRVNVA